MPVTITLPGWQAKALGLMLGLLLVLGAVAWCRHQAAQRRALEQLRQRIAADLHDDLGTNLSRITMLCAVMQQRLQTDDPEVQERLLRVAAISRESVEALSDIVWAINPEHDRVRDLTQRMRRIADDFCSARGLQFEFQCADYDLTATLETDTRRELLLMYKECLNNIARHAACQRITVEVQRVGNELCLRIGDNGKGFLLTDTPRGNGLQSMQVRAQRLGGSVQIQSVPQRGTTIVIRIPLAVTPWHWQRVTARQRRKALPTAPRHNHQTLSEETYIPV